MYKLLPILLVVVLSGCATVEERYADKPFIPDSARGEFSFSRIYQNLSKDTQRGTVQNTVKTTKSRFAWNDYSQCMRELADNKDSSFIDYFKDTSFKKIIECGRSKSSCLSGCTEYENRFIDFAELLLVEVEQGKLNSSTAKIELIKYQDDMLEQYKSMVFREQEKMARLEAEERARQRRIWNATMDSIQNSLDSMAESSRRTTESFRDMERNERLRRIERKLDRY